MTIDQILTAGAIVLGGMNVYMLTYVGKVIGPIKTKLIEHDRLLSERRKEGKQLWEKTTGLGERVATVEAKVD